MPSKSIWSSTPWICGWHPGRSGIRCHTKHPSAIGNTVPRSIAFLNERSDCPYSLVVKAGNGNPFFVTTGISPAHSHHGGCCPGIYFIVFSFSFFSARPATRPARSFFKRGITTSVSGSPRRQLYSITIRLSSTLISPIKINPL